MSAGIDIFGPINGLPWEDMTGSDVADGRFAIGGPTAPPMTPYRRLRVRPGMTGLASEKWRALL